MEITTDVDSSILFMRHLPRTYGFSKRLKVKGYKEQEVAVISFCAS